MNSANYPNYAQSTEMLSQMLGNGPYSIAVKFMFWAEANPFIAWMLLIGWFLALLFTLIHLLHNFRGADRICWFLVVMGVPLCGIPLYWLIGSGERAAESEADYLKRMGGGPRRV